MNEQRVREIVREELAQFKKEIRPTTMVFSPDIKLADADSVVDRFTKLLTSSVVPSKTPD
ncbi:hypothetical protein P4H46_21195 [Paenibacillus glucanolyticus]|uniref:hypothetical protein n=1 Tax=Paenibacillus glucanolyticus TaxID=59843 RepID=UPI0030C9F6A6